MPLFRNRSRSRSCAQKKQVKTFSEAEEEDCSCISSCKPSKIVIKTSRFCKPFCSPPCCPENNPSPCCLKPCDPPLSCEIKNCCCKRKKPNPKCKLPDCCCQNEKIEIENCETTITVTECCDKSKSICKKPSVCREKSQSKLSAPNRCGRSSLECDTPVIKSACCRRGCSKSKPCVTCCRIGCVDRPPFCIVCRRVRCICKDLKTS